MNEKNNVGLIAKMAKIMAKLERVPKRGRNDFHKYDYVMEADLADAVRKDLSEAGIMMFPEVLGGHEGWLETEKGKIYTGLFAFTFTDGVDSMRVVVPGCGYDVPGDKAPYKAMTGAEKYAIMKTFLIPTGDDPENEDADPPHRVRSDSAEHKRPVVSRDMAPRPGPEKKDGKNPDGFVNFGKNKGQHVSDLDEPALKWWTERCEEAVAKNEPKWHDSNLRKLAACKDEWLRRQPWRAIWNGALEMAQKQGIGEAGLIDLIKECTGKTNAKDLVPSDMAIISKTIQEIADA